MKKVLLIIALFFTLSDFASAQSTSVERWTALATSPSEEFSAELPGEPQLGSYDKKSRRYSVVFEKTYFFVFSDSRDEARETEKVFEFIKTNRAPATPTTIGNAAADIFEFADSEGFYHRILAVKTKAGSYIFQTVSETQNDPNVKRFFAGIKFDKILPGEPAPAKNEIEANTNLPADKENKSPGAGNGTGNGGNGTGEGNGTGTGTNQTTAPIPADKTSALRILSKPRANYTDWARFYQVSGKVAVRVTFAASGAVGSVSPVSKLPFGLTTNAINAARGITFEPARKEGTAYSVVKVVEYSFMIY